MDPKKHKCFDHFWFREGQFQCFPVSVLTQGSLLAFGRASGPRGFGGLKSFGEGSAVYLLVFSKSFAFWVPKVVILRGFQHYEL